MAYAGYYINLDRSTDRRVAMETQLGRLGVADRYRRFAAVDGEARGAGSTSLSTGEAGCFASHFRLLRQNRGSAAHLHVIEDDVILAGCAARVMDQIVASPTIEDHDLLFTDMALPVDFAFCRDIRIRYQRQIKRGSDGAATTIAMSLLPYIACTPSYLVNRRSIGRICDILEHELEQGPKAPIDVVIRCRVAEGHLRAKCLFPFITSVMPGRFDSTVLRGARDGLSDLVVDLVRHSFFVDCDRAATLALAERLLADNEADFHGRMFALAFGFMTSDAFQQP